MILGGGVAVCLLLSEHRAVIFAIAQLFCFSNVHIVKHAAPRRTGSVVKLKET